MTAPPGEHDRRMDWSREQPGGWPAQRKHDALSSTRKPGRRHERCPPDGGRTCPVHSSTLARYAGSGSATGRSLSCMSARTTRGRRNAGRPSRYQPVGPHARREITPNPTRHRNKDLPWRRRCSDTSAGRIRACCRTYVGSGDGYATWKPNWPGCSGSTTFWLRRPGDARSTDDGNSDTELPSGGARHRTPGSGRPLAVRYQFFRTDPGFRGAATLSMSRASCPGWLLAIRRPGHAPRRRPAPRPRRPDAARYQTTG
jgi:hypothetical protein